MRKGRHQDMIVTARRDNPRFNRAVIEKLKNKGTKAVILKDDRDLRGAIKELLPISRYIARHIRGGFDSVHLAFNSRQDFEDNFAARMRADRLYRLYIKETGIALGFDALKQDIAASLDDLSGFFDLKHAFFLSLRHHARQPGKSDRPLGWHTDDQLQVVRPLSDQGTLIGLRKDGKILLLEEFIRAGQAPPRKHLDTRQSLNLIKGDVIHAIPAPRKARWACLITTPQAA